MFFEYIHYTYVNTYIIKSCPCPPVDKHLNTFFLDFGQFGMSYAHINLTVCILMQGKAWKRTTLLTSFLLIEFLQAVLTDWIGIGIRYSEACLE